MPTKFICLANSYKEGGRCVAGTELDADNKPVMLNGAAKWIRPVCNNTPHGEIPGKLVESFQLLDIIELEVTAGQPQGYQSENFFFNEKTIKKTGSFNRE